MEKDYASPKEVPQPFKAICDRHSQTGPFIAVPHRYVRGGWIQLDCPTCGRGYMLQTDGVYMSDRPLRVVK